MTRTNIGNNAAAAATLDPLFQDSYLLVVELRQAQAAYLSKDLWALCVGQVEHTRQALEQLGASRRAIDHVSLAQCALLDETVLGIVGGNDHAAWANQPLQAKFFNRHQAGESFFEDLREILREPAPDPLVLTAYYRVLSLGFRGRYLADASPEREQLLATLAEQVVPMSAGHALPTAAAASRRGRLKRWPLPTLGHATAAGVLVVAAWWGLDYLLGSWITSHIQGQA